MKTTLKTLKKDATYDGKLDQETYAELVQWFCYHEAKKEYDKLVKALKENWVLTEHLTADLLIANAKDNAWDVKAWHELELKVNNEPTGIFDNDDPAHYDITATYLNRTIGSIVGLIEDYAKDPNVVTAILK
jgi:hypothetical protein|tara:strand:- start:80 stop:475 length:396 start_codon:yes stop_codon:yes gene_type:complete